MMKKKSSLFDLERTVSRQQAHARPTRSHTVRPSNKRAGLMAIEQELNHRQAKRSCSNNFDTGQPISVRTAHGYFPLFPHVMSAREFPHGTFPEPSYSKISPALDSAGQFFVEPFDEPVSADPVVDKSAGLKPFPLAPSIDASHQAAEQHPSICPPDHASSDAPALGQPADTGAVASPQHDPPEDFSEDIERIAELQQNEARPPERAEPILTKPDPQPTPLDQAQETPENTKATQQSHAIFDAMAASLPHANTFDLGRVNLSRRFSAIERDLEEEETKKQALPTSFSAAGSLDDRDLMDDLSVVSSLLEEKLRSESKVPVQQPPDSDKAHPVSSLTPPPITAGSVPSTPDEARVEPIAQKPQQSEAAPNANVPSEAEIANRNIVDQPSSNDGVRASEQGPSVDSPEEKTTCEEITDGKPTS